jgi:hypothetical protein
MKKISLLLTAIIVFVTINVFATDTSSVNIAIDSNNGLVTVNGTFISYPKIYLATTVTDPNNVVVYMNELRSGQDKNFAYNFNLNAGATSGIYTVTAKDATGVLVTNTVTVDFSNSLSTAGNIQINGLPVCNSEIEASYLYFNMNNIPEGNSEIIWQKSDSEQGIYSDFATGKKLYITNDYYNKYIRFRLNVKTNTDLQGIENLSPNVHITALPEIKNLKLTCSNNKVIATYDYSNFMGYSEYQSIYKWYSASSLVGPYILSTDKTSPSYPINPDENNRYLKLEITPMASTPADMVKEKTGIPVVSEPIQMVYTSSSTPSGGGTVDSVPKNTSVVIKIPAIPVTNTNDSVKAFAFKDIENHWAKDDITYLSELEVIKGKTGDTFEPDSKITRAEFIALIVRSMEIKLETYTDDFKDVSKDDWYADFIKTANKKNILSGYDGNVRPNDDITRQEMAIIAIKTYELLHPSVVADGVLEFEDVVDIGEWARQYVGKAYMLKLIKGTPENYFEPLKNTTRAEASVIIKRLLQMSEVASNVK